MKINKKISSCLILLIFICIDCVICIQNIRIPNDQDFNYNVSYFDKFNSLDLQLMGEFNFKDPNLTIITLLDAKSFTNHFLTYHSNEIFFLTMKNKNILSFHEHTDNTPIIVLQQVNNLILSYLIKF